LIDCLFENNLSTITLRCFQYLPL